MTIRSMVSFNRNIYLMLATKTCSIRTDIATVVWFFLSNDCIFLYKTFQANDLMEWSINYDVEILINAEFLEYVSLCDLNSVESLKYIK